MDFVKRYWYALFGVLAFPFLALHTIFVYKKLTGLSTWRAWGKLFVLGFVLVGLPSVATQLILILVSENPFATGLPAIVFFLTSIVAVFLLIRFREKHGISKNRKEVEG